MALIKCSECNNQVSNKATSCPKCGAPIKPASSSSGCAGRSFLLLFLFAVIFYTFTFINENSPPPTARVNLLPGMAEHLQAHPELGQPTSTESAADWKEGKRLRVYTNKGRGFLFYMKDGKVESVYESFNNGPNQRIWNRADNTQQ